MSERARAYEMMYGRRQTAVGQPREKAKPSSVQPSSQPSSAEKTIEDILSNPHVQAEAAANALRDRRFY